MVTETAAFVQREVYGQGQMHMAMCSIWAPRNMTRIVNNSMGCGGGAMHDGAMGGAVGAVCGVWDSSGSWAEAPYSFILLRPQITPGTRSV